MGAQLILTDVTFVWWFGYSKIPFPTQSEIVYSFLNLYLNNVYIFDTLKAFVIYFKETFSHDFLQLRWRWP